MWMIQKFDRGRGTGVVTHLDILPVFFGMERENREGSRGRSSASPGVFVWGSGGGNLFYTSSIRVGG
jgi:hypothetical protein